MDGSTRFSAQVSGWSIVSDKSGKTGRAWVTKDSVTKLKVCILPCRSRFGELLKGPTIERGFSFEWLRPQTKYLTSLYLSFHIHETGIMGISFI